MHKKTPSLEFVYNVQLLRYATFENGHLQQ